MRVIMLSGSKNIPKINSKKKKKNSKMCRPFLASKIKALWLTQASHVCTVKKNLALGTQTCPNPEIK